MICVAALLRIKSPLIARSANPKIYAVEYGEIEEKVIKANGLR